VVRVYDVIRVVLWVIARLLDLIGTFIFNVLIPFLQLVFVSALSFINFMVGLLLGEFRMEMTILAPLFLFIGSWLLWLFWPQIACFIDPTLWNIIYDLTRIQAKVALFFPTFLNSIIRIWNSLVPIIGFLIYIIVEVVVLFASFVVQLLGAFDVMALFSSLMQIFVVLVEIVINVVVAVVGVITTDLSQFSDAIGPTVAAIITAAKILIAVTVWVFGALWTLLEPILVALIGVFKFIKNHFFLRSLLAIDEFSTDEDAPPAEKLWHTFGTAATRYWNADTAADGVAALGSINRWHLANPPGVAAEYYWFVRASYMGEMAGANMVGRTLYSDTKAPPGWGINATASMANIRHARGHEHLAALASHMLTRPGREPLPADWVPLHEEIDTHHVECDSHLCGGVGKRLRHPVRTIIEEPPMRLFDAMGGSHDLRSHRRRFIHTVSIAHALRKTMGHVAHKHWKHGNGELPRRIQRAFEEITGHGSLHAFINHHTSHHEHPIDAVASLLPIPSNWTLVRMIRRFNGDDGSDGEFYADWLGQREMYYNEDTADEHGRRRLWVMRDTGSLPAEAVSHRDRRGPFQPDNSGGGGVSGPLKVKGSSNSAIPGLPVFELLYTQTCTSKPRNQLCLPEITPQIGCLLSSIFLLFPKDVPVQLCDYEQQCADVGFCIIQRPTIGPDIFVVLNNISSWISWCWLRNGIVWILIVLSIILPVIRGTFQVLAALIPWLAWFFNAFVELIPELVSTQELVCLFPFFYGFVLIVVLVYIAYIFILPFLFWFWRTIISFDATLGALRAVEATMLAYKEGGSRQLIENFWRVNHNGVLPGDPWMNSPLVAQMPQPGATVDPFEEMRGQAERAQLYSGAAGRAFPSYLSPKDGYVPDDDDYANVPPAMRPELAIRTSPGFAAVPLMARIGADAEAAQPAHARIVTPEAGAALRVYTRALQHGQALFGPTPRPVMMGEAYAYEMAFRPIIQPAQWSGTWLRRYLAEHAHQAAANSTRRPPALVYQHGMFGNVVMPDAELP
jgi:hypothetical protein